jgi:predicted RNA-binding Zn-ribbon protein involved in translation (DUF1610 family)
LSVRNNMDRLGANDQKEEAKAPVAAMSPLNFVAPTEFVELPSKGLGYAADHPLCGKDVIEIRYMTAKEEDILTSATLLKKGIAVDRFMQNIICDSSINIDDLLIGDKNAILIAARASGYGSEYETQIQCPNCGTKAEMTFDLTTPQILGSKYDEKFGIKKTDNGTFLIDMPFSKFAVEVRLLTGKDEKYITQLSKNKAKGGLTETTMTDQYKRMIVSVENIDDRETINHYVDNMPLRDARHLRLAYRMVSPDVKIVQDFECRNCGHEQELEVPFGADFLWPDR